MKMKTRYHSPCRHTPTGSYFPRKRIEWSCPSAAIPQLTCLAKACGYRVSVRKPYRHVPVGGK